MEKELIYEQVKVLRDKFDMFNSINFLLLLFWRGFGSYIFAFNLLFCLFFLQNCKLAQQLYT